MMQTAKGSVLAALVALSLSACGNDDQPNLMNLRPQGNGPDEFGIVPPKPLENAAGSGAIAGTHAGRHQYHRRHPA